MTFLAVKKAFLSMTLVTLKNLYAKSLGEKPSNKKP